METLTSRFNRDDAKALVGFGSALIMVGLMDMTMFIRFMALTEERVIEESEWISDSFFALLCQRGPDDL